MVSYTPMIQQYMAIKADYKDAFLFFRLGDFYEMFFDDAKVASKILEITLTGRDGGSKERIPMCGIPYHSADTYISKLIELGYKVAICEQVEDPRLSKGVVKREVVRVITPGTVIEGKKIEDKNNNYICSIAKENGQIGFSISDISTGEFYATEFDDDVDCLISELNQYEPSEILVDSELLEDYKENLLQIKSTISITNQKSIKSYIESIYNQFNEINVQTLSNTIIKSIGQLISYIQENQKKKLAHINELNIFDSKQFMILDPFSKKNLELVKTYREQSRNGSLLWLLDETQTAMGKRLLKRWLEKPLLSSKDIGSRLDMVEDLYKDLILSKELVEKFTQIYDIERLIAKTSYGNVTPRDLSNLKISLENVREISNLILDSNSDNIKKLVKGLDLCIDIASLIEESIIENAPISSKDGGVIKRGYNKQLDDYYSVKMEGKDWLKDLEQKERKLTGIKSLKVSFNKVFGYYIEITKSNLSEVPNDRYVRKQTLANAERYITEELKHKEVAILEAEEKMLELEYKVFSEVREKISSQSKRLLSLSSTFARLDVLLSFAIISTKQGYVRPTFNQDGVINISEGRHPVIEAINNGRDFFPNDTVLNQDSEQILIITGPNMSGKSTYMRQIALIIIMAQIGCFVPAKDANLSIIDRIFTRIGAGDDLTGGQSTFMIEMMEAKQAITQATPNSLILLDEIGRGTSTYDGMAIAQAIIQYIHENVNAKTLFSTHYHELTSLAESYSRIKNIHVSVIEKDNKVIFLHKIREGKTDKSYGIHVAELAGMPQQVIESAKLILHDIESKNINYQIKLDFDNTDSNIRSNTNEYNEIIDLIESIDFLNVTPMEGFQILYDIQARLRK